jgi:hypothetical protein
VQEIPQSVGVASFGPMVGMRSISSYFVGFSHDSSIYDGNIAHNISPMKEAMAHNMEPCFR